MNGAQAKQYLEVRDALKVGAHTNGTILRGGGRTKGGSHEGNPRYIKIHSARRKLINNKQHRDLHKYALKQTFIEIYGFTLIKKKSQKLSRNKAKELKGN